MKNLGAKSTSWKSRSFKTVFARVLRHQGGQKSCFSHFSEETLYLEFWSMSAAPTKHLHFSDFFSRQLVQCDIEVTKMKRHLHMYLIHVEETPGYVLDQIRSSAELVEMFSLWQTLISAPLLKLQMDIRGTCLALLMWKHDRSEGQKLKAFCTFFRERKAWIWTTASL